MSLIDDFDLRNYESVEDLKELLREIENEMSVLRGYQRGALEKLAKASANENHK